MAKYSIIDERDILKSLSYGDESAIKIIFDQYYESLCLYAESIIRNHEAAEEIVEDIFVHVWLHAKTSPIKSSIKNYLYKSTFNNSLKYLNKLKIENKFLDHSNYYFEDMEIIEPLSSTYPLSNILVNELMEKSQIILKALPDQCRLIYSLNRFENLSYSEIAKKLNITVGTVKTQMSRAFNKFRSGLQEFIPLILTVILIK